MIKSTTINSLKNMIFKFLTLSDIEAAIKPQYLEQLLDGHKQTHLSNNEAAAVSFVKGYLNNRFDVSKIFLTIKDHNKLFSYNGPDIDGNYTDFCYYEGAIYACLQDIVGDLNMDDSMLPGFENSEFWKQYDPRDSNLVNQITNITVFYLHRHVNPVRIPNFWVDMYNQAKDWLTDVKSGAITPDLPRVIQDTGDFIPHGSNPQIQHRY
jgi:hypothetical protein